MGGLQYVGKRPVVPVRVGWPNSNQGYLMTFDRSSATNLATLKNEVNDDPQTMGYHLNGNTNDILLKLNRADQNVTGAAYNREVSELTVFDIASVIDPIEYDALSAYDTEWIKMFINQDMGTSALEFKTKFLSLFDPGSATRTAVNALLSVAVSRSEELFGYGTVISKQDWIAARDS